MRDMKGTEWVSRKEALRDARPHDALPVFDMTDLIFR